MPAVGLNALADLGGQFAGGCQHQARTGLGLCLGMFVQQFQYGQGKTGSLAGAGLGAGQDIPARSTTGMAWCWMGWVRVALIGDGAQDIGREAEKSKTCLGITPESGPTRR